MKFVLGNCVFHSFLVHWERCSRSNYAVLRETVKPAVLIELGYMDSPEYKKISDDKYQNKLVEGLVKGLRNFYKTAK